MGNTHRLSENEKKLLNAIGKSPELSRRELLNHTSYKWVGTLKRKLTQFRELGMVLGPLYDIDYGKLCKNPLRKLYCIIESDQSHRTLVSYMECIGSVAWIYFILSPHKELLNVGFYSTDDKETTALLHLLKDNSIISNYIIRVFSHRRMIENPDFFGDPVPSLDTLLTPCDIPDMTYRCHDTDWNECDIAVLPYLLTGYKNAKSIEIMRGEKMVNRTWTYEQVKYSREKMVKNRLIEKKYLIFPFQPSRCVNFNLFLKDEDMDVTQTILYNFAKGARVYKEYVVCEDWGSIRCICHPLFLTDLMGKLDSIDEIKEKELFQLRSVPKKYSVTLPPELQYFDIDTQTLYYPYHIYKEKIKEKIENE